MARYRKIEVAVWSDARFRSFSSPQPNAQTLWLYLLSGPRTTMFPGLVVARPEVIASDLGWPVEAFRQAFAEASGKGMARADFGAGLVVLNRALIDSSGEPRETAKPESPNVLRSWSKSWNEIPECDLKTEYLRMLGSFVEGLGEGWVRAYRESFGKALAKGTPHPSPNQDQEQEQEVVGGNSANPPTPPLVRSRRSGTRPEAGPDPAALELSRIAIAEINRLSGRHYDPESEANLRLARGLLKRKRTADDALLVIRSKRAWIGDDKMGQYFRPTTLLGPENFASYLDDAKAKKRPAPQASTMPIPDELPISGYYDPGEAT